jgi:DNA modification methylase
VSIVHGDCITVMAGMPAESVDAICTDPPYGLGFMGKAWDSVGALTSRPPSALHPAEGTAEARGAYPRTGKGPAAVAFDGRAFQSWCEEWGREAYRVAKPSAYLLAFGGTRTVHRMTVALEDAGWIIRDMLVWGYASGFPKSKASLKPAWEPIVMARKPGPLRMLAIDECRLPVSARSTAQPLGRWPANLVLTDPIFDGGVEGVVGGGAVDGEMHNQRASSIFGTETGMERATVSVRDSGTYSRFFLIPKADRADREPVLGGLPERVISVWGGEEDDLSEGKKSTRPRVNVHPTVKSTDLMRHLVRLVTPTGGTVLDPFGGSGSTAIAAEKEGFDWILIEREAEYVEIAKARLNGTQRGLGLEAS